MKQRKKYLIDKKIQLGFAFSILGAGLVAAALIISSIAVGVVYNNGKIEDVLNVQKNIVSFLGSRISVMEEDIYRDTLKKISENHDSNILILQNIARNNRIFLIALILLTIGQAAVIFVLGVRRTHRITGPIYVMTHYIKDIIEGREPAARPLRKKDELKEFYELLKQMVGVLKKR